MFETKRTLLDSGFIWLPVSFIIPLFVFAPFKDSLAPRRFAGKTKRITTKDLANMKEMVHEGCCGSLKETAPGLSGSRKPMVGLCQNREHLTQTICVSSRF